jgi:hypothetical protein
MANYLYIDAGTIELANEVGGTHLLDKYARLAEIKGLRLGVTDVVWDELFVRSRERGPPRKVKLSPALERLQIWLSENAETLVTHERRLLDDFRSSRLADYGLDHRGERSIIEHMSSNPEPHKSAIFSDDTKFHGEVRKWGGDTKMPHIQKLPFDVRKATFANPDMLANFARQTGPSTRRWRSPTAKRSTPAFATRPTCCASGKASRLRASAFSARSAG